MKSLIHNYTNILHCKYYMIYTNIHIYKMPNQTFKA